MRISKPGPTSPRACIGSRATAVEKLRASIPLVEDQSFVLGKRLKQIIGPFKNAGKRVGVSTDFHNLRHAFETWLVEHDVPSPAGPEGADGACRWLPNRGLRTPFDREDAGVRESATATTGREDSTDHRLNCMGRIRAPVSDVVSTQATSGSAEAEKSYGEKGKASKSPLCAT